MAHQTDRMHKNEKKQKKGLTKGCKIWYSNEAVAFAAGFLKGFEKKKLSKKIKKIKKSY